MARGPRYRRNRRRIQADGSRAALRRARSRDPPGEGAVPLVDRGPQGTPGFGRGHRRHRQVAPRVGVLQVHRRSLGSHPLAPRTLPLVRPEFLERHPDWGAGKRAFTSMYLEPLSPEAMEQLLDGVVPGLPAEVREKILDRAEGVPLYAVETVRMLLDRGLLEAEDNA